MTKEEKLVVIDSLAEQLQAYPHFYIADIESLNAEQTAALRRKCFESDVKLVVVKNTLLGKAVQEVKSGKIDFKVDKFGIIHTSVGKVSFSAEQIVDNAKEVLNMILKLKPAAAKGSYVKSIYLSTTMSPGLQIDSKSVETK